MFDRLIELIGKNNLEKITNKRVAIVGLGGVGGFVLEALVRSGVKNITICDGDVVDITNLNRQIIATTKNIGEKKVDVATKRCLEINPEVNIISIDKYIDKNNIHLLSNIDYIIDACDDLAAKIALIKLALDNDIKIICALGTGKRINPEGITLTRLDKTCNDALARSLRHRLRKENLSLKIPVVYHAGLPLNNEKTVSSCIFPPAVAGLYLAYFVINDILEKNS